MKSTNSEQEVLEIFSDENVFVECECENTSTEAGNPTADKNLVPDQQTEIAPQHLQQLSVQSLNNCTSNSKVFNPFFFITIYY